MAVVHVEDRIFLKCVFVVPRRQKDAEPMLRTRGTSERRHQLKHTATRIFAEKRVDLQ
jgi:hypothetical protein